MSIDFTIDTEIVFTVDEVLNGAHRCLRDLTLATPIPELSLYRILEGEFYLCNEADSLSAGLYSIKLANHLEEALIVVMDADSELGLSGAIAFEVAKTRTKLEFVIVIAVAIYCGDKAGVGLCDHSGFWTGQCDVQPSDLRKLLTLSSSSTSLEDAAERIVGSRRG